MGAIEKCENYLHIYFEFTAKPFQTNKLFKEISENRPKVTQHCNWNKLFEFFKNKNF